MLGDGFTKAQLGYIGASNTNALDKTHSSPGLVVVEKAAGDNRFPRIQTNMVTRSSS